MDFTVALNVSAGGVLIATRRPLRRLSQLQLEIPSVPAERLKALLKRSRPIKARVIRFKNQTSVNLCALQFTRPLIHAPIVM